MGKHNYSKDFRKENTTPEVEDQVEEVVEEVVEETVEVETEVEPTPIIGVVTGCEKLNVRIAAFKTARVRCVIDESSKIQIDEKESTDEFYKVVTESGVEGYCMKEYIKVTQ